MGEIFVGKTFAKVFPTQAVDKTRPCPGQCRRLDAFFYSLKADRPLSSGGGGREIRTHVTETVKQFSRRNNHAEIKGF